MKTTMELPDELLVKAKAVAARRRTTLRAIMEQALRRELGDIASRGTAKKQAITMLNDYGFPVLRRRGGGRLTSEMVYAMQENEDFP